MRIFLTSLLGLVLLLGVSCKEKSNTVFYEDDITIIPKPQTLNLQEGSFVLNKNTVLYLSQGVDTLVVGNFRDKIEKVTGYPLPYTEDAPIENVIIVQTSSAIEKEHYDVEITSEMVMLTANDLLGLQYGVETLSQLLPPEIEANVKSERTLWEFPNLHIEDGPRFKWRGVMLDVSRHFFKKEYIKKTIDRLVMLKMNTLHFHLVDDQGWRIEIKKYPKLTAVGGFRVDQENKHWNARETPSLEEKATFGGFYTQEDIKEIVAYATARGITVIPEIEMPAHVMSAIAAYPELSCFNKPIMVPSGGVWPITDIYCAGKDSTFTFLEDVLTEVMDLFPSQYIHVGGDEATKTNWEKCPHCQKRVKDEGLANVEELQSYFMKRIEKFVTSKGRILLGWDEILEGGLPAGATVMSWRGFEGGIQAAAEGHDVVMTPTSYCYFDYYQGNPDYEPLAFGAFTLLSKVYNFDPVAPEMTAEQAKHVLGGQANLWAEYVTTPEHSEYMLFPRIAAMSEALWTEKEHKDWTNFSDRLQKTFKRYDAMGIHYAKSAYQVEAASAIKGNEIKVALTSEFPNADIRYMVGEGNLAEDGIAYTDSISITKTSTLKAGVFKDGVLVGDPLSKEYKFHKAFGKKVTYTTMYSDSYPGMKETTLVNVLRGSKNFHDGHWQGWIGDDMELIIDLESPQEITRVAVGTMEAQGAGIYFPMGIEVYGSQDNVNYEIIGKSYSAYANNPEVMLKDFEVVGDTLTYQYVKVIAKNLPKNPKGGQTWLFVDEVIIE